MEMLLMGAALAMFGLAVSCLAFGAATHEEPAMEPAPALGKEAVKAAAVNARFFAAVPALPVAAANRVPIEALLLQIENQIGRASCRERV